MTTPQYTWPILGWLAAGRDSLKGRAATLAQMPDLPPDGLVVLVGPVWAAAPATPLNTVIDALKDGRQCVAALLTCGDPKQDEAPLDKIAERLRRPLTAATLVSNAIQDTPEGLAKIANFAADCSVPVT